MPILHLEGVLEQRLESCSVFTLHHRQHRRFPLRARPAPPALLDCALRKSTGRSTSYSLGMTVSVKKV